MKDEQAPAQDTIEAEILHGARTKDTIDVYKLAELEQSKTTFLKNISAFTPEQAQTQLNDLFNALIEVMEKYFMGQDGNTDEIKKFKVSDLDFYEYKKLIKGADIELLSIIANKGFAIYNHFARIMGVALKMTTNNPKKKLIECLFGTIENYNDAFADKLLLNYKSALYLTKLPDNMFSLYNYCLSEMPKNDLDSNNLIIGFSRIGKSTFTIDACRYIYCFKMLKTLDYIDNYLTEYRFINKNFVFNKRQSLEDMIKTKYAEPIVADEGYLIADKRSSMQLEQYKLTETYNTYASNNNIEFTQIQNLTDIDQRYINKANSITLLTARGDANLYSTFKGFAIIKEDYGFDYLQKNSWLLWDRTTGLDSLKIPHSFISNDISWSKMANSPLYNSYTRAKHGYQVEGLSELDLLLSKNSFN
jgi:hypothetical protein